MKNNSKSKSIIIQDIDTNLIQEVREARKNGKLSKSDLAKLAEEVKAIFR